jgi:hypothetical protein
MAAISIAPDEPDPFQPLENGDSVGAVEFMRRYEAMPDVKKAELVEGIVYMGSPVSLTHSEPPAPKPPETSPCGLVRKTFPSLTPC